MDTTGKPRRIRRRTILLLLTVALLNVPAIAVATHLFRDVPHGSTHAAGIHYLADAGITAGCTPTTYCPNDNLTRAQMGSFLYRASGNAPGIAPNTNAATLSAGAIVTVESENLVTNATHNVADVTCPAGTVVVGGGGDQSSGSGFWVLVNSAPVGNGWYVSYRATSGTANQLAFVYARCLAVGQ